MKESRLEALKSFYELIADLKVSSPVFMALVEVLAYYIQKLGGDWYARLTADITDTSTHIYIDDPTGFSERGLVRIDNEFIAYQKEDSSLRILQRGCVNTTPKLHTEGTAVVDWMGLVSQLKEIQKQVVRQFSSGELLTLFAKDRGLGRRFLGHTLNDPTLRRVIPVLFMQRPTLPVVNEAIRRLARFDYPRLFVTTHPTNYEVLVFVYREPFRELDPVEAWEDDPQPGTVGGFYIPQDINDTAVGGYFASDITEEITYEQSLYFPAPAELSINPTLHTNINDTPDYYPDTRWFLPYGCGIKFVEVS